MCGIFAFFGHSRSPQQLEAAFATLQHRGPDQSSFECLRPGVWFGFHRLAIMDLTHAGQQPFHHPHSATALICNGEIYNSDALRPELEKVYPFHSHSDCEVILPLIEQEGFAIAMRQLDAEFALVYYDSQKQCLWAARDPLGIRPLFYGNTEVPGEIAFASEAKALHQLCIEIKAFPPGHYYDGRDFHPFRSMTQQAPSHLSKREDTLCLIRDQLTEAVKKRLHSDRELGCLLSGGLDSSLVAALATQLQGSPIQTFAVGCTVGPIDMKYAAEAAAHIGSDHHEIYFELDEAVAILEEVIYQLETWDITTVRAAIGMFIVCRTIRRQSKVKVLLTGEVSDELFGYKYTDFAPDAEAFQQEARKRIYEIHSYDVLRADRSISSHGLEARVPFGDLAFVDTVMAIDPRFKMNKNGIGKSLLREAFAGTGLLPDSILYREKAAFSDAVGHSMVDTLKAFADKLISSDELSQAERDFPIHTPFTKEALLYRRIFEKFYAGRAELIPAYWMPNRNWPGCAVDDPSARVLKNYGKSGF